MPADRSKPLKRSPSGGKILHIYCGSMSDAWGTSGSHFVWTLPVEGSPASELPVTNTATPLAFSDDLPPLVDAPPCEFIFSPFEECPTQAPRRVTHSKKKPDNHIPRPPNAFILFRSSFIKSQHVSTEVETNHSTLSKIIGLTWQNLPEEERQVWHSKAKAALDDHKKKFPQYAFRPSQTKSKGGTPEKRKVREVGPKDLKRCAKIAELLVEGKKGSELDAAIQEFDKYHVPEIVTRFEAPITARAYRRSSSAPIPETENARTGQIFVQSSPKPNKLRASSTRPTRCSSPAEVISGQKHNSVQRNQYDSMNVAPLKQDPAFVSDSTAPPLFARSIDPLSQDFANFSFDNMTSPLGPFDCDPLSSAITAQEVNQFGEQQELFSPLSVSTSFSGMDDWSTQSATSSSPSASEFDYFTSPISTPSPSTSFDFEFNPSVEKSFNELTTHFSNYQPCISLGEDPFFTPPNSDFTSMFVSPHSLPLSDVDIDFANFMNAIPQY